MREPQGGRNVILLRRKTIRDLLVAATAAGSTTSTCDGMGAGSFLARRRVFAAQKLIVALIDAPSDREDGMDAAFRMGNAHAGDIDAVGGYIKQLADVPVWAVGTSTGTWSAAWNAIAADNIDGLVLTSTITQAEVALEACPDPSRGVASLPLDEVHCCRR